MIIIKILSILYILIVLALIIYGLISPKKKEKNITKEKYSPQEQRMYDVFNKKVVFNENEADEYFKLKDKFMTEEEKCFFRFLIKEFSEKYFVLSHVRVADIINTEQAKDIFILKNQKTVHPYFNNIIAMHFDFVLIDKSDCEIALLIELDDYNHDINKETKINDDKKNKIINSKNVKLKLRRVRYQKEGKISVDEYLKKYDEKEMIEDCLYYSNYNFHFKNAKPKQIDEN